jgi:hypothetical protein
MKHETYKEKEVQIENTNEDFNYWINRPYISQETKLNLENADILIVPVEGIRDIEYPLFPVKTEDVLSYFRKNLDEKTAIDICIEEKDYKELALHYDLINIATFIVSSVVLPMFVNILSSYIDERIKNNSDRAIRVSFIVQKKSSDSIKVTYEGKPEYFRNTIESIKEIKEE